MDLPRNVMAVMGASLSKDDIKSLRLVSKEVCWMANDCIKAISIRLLEPSKGYMTVKKMEKAMQRFLGLPFSAAVSVRVIHLLSTRGLQQSLSCLDLRLRDSTVDQRSKIAKILQGASGLKSALLTGVEGQEGLGLVGNCRALETLDLLSCDRSSSPVDFRQLAVLSNLQSLTFGHPVDSGELSSITCLTGLTRLQIAVKQEASLRPLTRLRRLINICIYFRQDSKIGFSRSASAEAVRELALCTSLVYLDVHSNHLPGRGDIAPALKAFPRLELCRWNLQVLERR